MSNTNERRLTEDQLRELHRAMHYWTSPLLVGEPCARRRPQRRVPDNPLALRILEIRKMPTQKTGFIYFARCESYVKIGYATDIADRFAGIESGNPFPLVLVGYLRGSTAMERQIHETLAPFRHRFEWFRYEPDLAEAIRQSTHRPERYAWLEKERNYERNYRINRAGVLVRHLNKI